MEKTKLYIVVDNAATKYLPKPLEIGEIVEEVVDVRIKVPDGYIRVKHSGIISTFARMRFKRYISKK